MADVTQILSQIEQGDHSAAEQLLPLVYEELRKLAAARLSRESPGQTLQATALVHEAYLRLVDTKKTQHWDSRGHFFAAAGEAERNANRADGLRLTAESSNVLAENPGLALLLAIEGTKYDTDRLDIHNDALLAALRECRELRRFSIH